MSVASLSPVYAPPTSILTTTNLDTIEDLEVRAVNIGSIGLCWFELSGVVNTEITDSTIIITLPSFLKPTSFTNTTSATGTAVGQLTELAGRLLSATTIATVNATTQIVLTFPGFLGNAESRRYFSGCISYVI